MTTSTTRAEIVDAAYNEVVTRFGPVPVSSNARREWFDKHRGDFHAAVRRIAACEPAPPLQEVLL